MKGAGAAAFSLAAFLVVVAFFAAAFLSPPTETGVTTRSSSSTASGSVIEGVVAGYVTVGPSQPVCPADQSCDVDMGGYSLVFAPSCPGPSSCQDSVAVLSPSGHYSILLAPGNYSVTGLRPSCGWPGCSSAFPKSVTVLGGVQIILNFEIDTGIR